MIAGQLAGSSGFIAEVYDQSLNMLGWVSALITNIAYLPLTPSQIFPATIFALANNRFTKNCFIHKNLYHPNLIMITKIWDHENLELYSRWWFGQGYARYGFSASVVLAGVLLITWNVTQSVQSRWNES